MITFILSFAHKSITFLSISLQSKHFICIFSIKNGGAKHRHFDRKSFLYAPTAFCASAGSSKSCTPSKFEHEMVT